MQHSYFSKSPYFLTLLVLMVFLVSCGGKNVGSIPAGTPNTGNGTPVILKHVPGTSLAYVSQNQLFVGPDGASPERVTNFDFADKPNVFWRQPVWSPDAQMLAFVMTAWPGAIGGGGCPPPDYAANGALYLYDFGRNRTDKLTLPGEDSINPQTSPYNGAWEYIYWEDTDHLLAWYNGVAGKTRNLPGLYRYDIKRQQFSLVVSQKSLGVATRFVGKDNGPFKSGNDPLMLSMKYSSGQLFYETVANTSGRPAALEIFQRSVGQPDQVNHKIADAGQMNWCGNGARFLTPGWDVSPDGRRVVAQVTLPAGTSNIQVFRTDNGSATTLFARVPTAVLAQDVLLAWGFDDQHIALSTASVRSNAGPYSTTVSDPGSMQSYTPGRGGLPQWSPDSKMFVLESPGVFSNDKPAVYLYKLGEMQGKQLLSDADFYVWG